MYFRNLVHYAPGSLGFQAIIPLLRETKMALGDNLAYELNENGERVLVKSIESVSRAYLRFTNWTSRPVDVAWRDFNGIRCEYATLRPGQSFDIDTFLTHPWEFTDRATKERFVINNKPIFRAPVNLGDMRYRTNWNITVGVRTLRYSALLCVATLVTTEEYLRELELPRPLEEELLILIEQMRSMRWPIE